MITNVLAFKASALTLEDTASWSLCIVGWGAEVTTSSLMAALTPLSLWGGDRGGRGAKRWWPPCLVPAEQSPFESSPLLHAPLPRPPLKCICARAHPLPHTLNQRVGAYMDCWGCHMHALYTRLLLCADTTPICTHSAAERLWEGLVGTDLCLN